ncbi:MAG: MerR family transcriptional regulator [Limisphaerales bacterium]
MNTPSENDPPGLPLFEPDMDATYTIETVASLTGATSQTILHYQERGLISPVAGPGQFDDEALRTLRRIEHLRSTCEVNESGLKLILGLMDEVERLRAELRVRR